MVPNIVYFIYFTAPRSRPFSYLNYLAINRAKEIQKPDKLIFLCNQEPSGPGWEYAKPLVDIQLVEPPRFWAGVSLQYPQYQSDIVRLETLIENGGIYLDTDSILLKSLDPLRHHECVLGVESYVGNAQGLNTVDEAKVQSISATPIIAEPGAEFLNLWLEGVADGLLKTQWAYHSVVLPLEIYRLKPSLLALQPAESFIPFDFRDDSILQTSKEAIDRAMIQVKDAYCIHMWDTIWNEKTKFIDANYMETVDNAFTRLMK